MIYCKKVQRYFGRKQIVDQLAESTKIQEEERMNTNDYTIRLEEKKDCREVESLVRDSFWNVYRPGCLEHFTLKKLRDDANFVPELDFVMEQNGRIIGQNIFVRASLKLDDGRDLPIMTMGPICIANDRKHMGYGKKLLDYCLDKAANLGCGAICLEGDINFYGKSGFHYASDYGIRYHGLPESADASFFLCKELIPGYLDDITGEYRTPEGYFACERYPEEFAEYEAGFPENKN